MSELVSRRGRTLPGVAHQAALVIVHTHDGDSDPHLHISPEARIVKRGQFTIDDDGCVLRNWTFGRR